jgi:hypothetical protein
MRIASLVQRINLLSTYIEKLLNPPPSATPSRLDGQLHGNWTDSDWEVFDNRYYVHAPKLSLSNGTRNVSVKSVARTDLTSARSCYSTTTSPDGGVASSTTWLQGEALRSAPRHVDR